MPVGTSQLWFPTYPNTPPVFPTPVAPAPTGTTPTPASTTPFNINPPPVSGTNPFGYIPGPVTQPNPYQDLSAVFPNLAGANSQVSADLLNQLQGVLSPATQAAIQDASARFGISSGMPGSGLVHNRTARDLGLTTEQLQQQGLQNYNSLIPTISGTQTVNPNLQAQLAMWNAINRSAPDPTQAANYAQQLFNEYLNRTRGPQGGTGNYSSPMLPPSLTGGSSGGGYGSGGFGFNDLAPGSGGVADPSVVAENDPLTYMLGLDPQSQQDLQGFDPYGSFSDETFYDLGGF